MSKLTDAEFADKVEWEGGVYDALCEYGLGAKDLEDENSDLFKLVTELDKVKGPFMRLLLDIEEALEDVRDAD